MITVRLEYHPLAARWEATPVERRILDSLEVDGVRILFDESNVAVGFAFDVEGDVGSQIGTLSRYFQVNELEQILERAKRSAEEISVTFELVPIQSASIISLAVSAPARTKSRLIDVGLQPRSIRISVALRWWFALWGMWFTIERGDGLVLAKLPVRSRQKFVEVLNAFPVSSNDVSARLHRGPRTRWRLGVALAVIALTAGGLFAWIDDQSESSTNPLSSPLMTQPPDSVQPDFGASTSPVFSLPPQRQTSSEYVSDDGVARLDIDILGTPRVFAPGDVIDIELHFDRSSINAFGSTTDDGNQTEAYDSCRENLNFYREVPPQLGMSEQFTVAVMPVGGGEQTVIGELGIVLTVVGAMVEGCPIPQLSGTAPYRAVMRAYYAPLTLQSQVPTNLAAGEYEIVMKIAYGPWGTTTVEKIEIGS